MWFRIFEVCEIEFTIIGERSMHVPLFTVDVGEDGKLRNSSWQICNFERMQSRPNGVKSLWEDVRFERRKRYRH